MPACCICVGGVNYTKSCSCLDAQNCGLSMSTVGANASLSQGSDCGGASALSQALNAVGKWGTVLTATFQGKPTVSSGSKLAVGAKGSTTVSGNRFSQNTLILILIVAGILLFVALKK